MTLVYSMLSMNLPADSIHSQYNDRWFRLRQCLTGQMNNLLQQIIRLLHRKPEILTTTKFTNLTCKYIVLLSIIFLNIYLFLGWWWSSERAAQPQRHAHHLPQGADNDYRTVFTGIMLTLISLGDATQNLVKSARVRTMIPLL